MISACQKSGGEGVSIVVPAWWAVLIAKVSIGIGIG